jgi:tetratricopeptide (TPR) repeat protein
VRFVKLSTLIALAAIPAVAQNPPPATGGNSAATSKTSQMLPRSCLAKQHPSEQVSALLETVRDHPTAGAYNTLGVLYAQADRVACAISAFEAALRLESQNWQAHYNLALALLRKGDPPRAESELRTALRQKPDSAAAHFALGTLLQDEQKLGAAADEFLTVAKIDPNFVPASISLADVHMAQGKPAAAISTLQDAIAHSSPESSEQLKLALAKVYARGGANLTEAQKLNEQANNFLAGGNARAAVEAYRKALQLNPRDPLLHYNLSLALDQLADRAAERQELARTIQLDANLAPAHNQLGLVSLQDLQRSESEREFKKALEINPKYAEAQNNLGILYSQQGKDSEAAALFRQAIQNAPKYARAHVNLGLTLARQDAFSQAEQEIRSALEIDPDNVEASSALGMLQAKTGRAIEAVESFRKVVALQPHSSDAHLNLGIALVDRYDRTTGFKEFLEAARLDPNSPGVHYNLGRFFFETAKYDQARTELETASRLLPNFAGALYFLALTERQVNHVERAIELFQKVVALQPDNADAQYLLGRNLERAGKTAEAIAHWKMALQADPNQSEALYNLARTLNRMHDPEAQQYQDRFHSLQEKQQTAERLGVLGNFAIHAANAQNWPQALQQMQEAIALCGQCEEAAHLHRNLGLMYCRTGNLEDGEKELRAALALNPDDVDAKKTIGVLQSLRATHDKEAGTSKN